MRAPPAAARRMQLKDGTAAVVPKGVHHIIRNTDTREPLKLYAVYCPPQHNCGVKVRRQPRDDE
jgi:mannose-6-phosphate isomerase-like protein (cupin superfamily)